MSFKHIGVIGAGSWGTALACAWARGFAQPEVILYSQRQAIISEVNNQHTNTASLPSVILPLNITATNSLSLLTNCDLLIIATSAADFASTIEQLLAAGLKSKAKLLIASKGLCTNPVSFFSQKMDSLLPNIYGFISGPSFALELASGGITALTISSHDMSFTHSLAQQLSGTNNIFCSISNDIITIQLAGIIKNIAAIKAGTLKQQKAGENQLAWLVSAALEDIAATAHVFGGKAESLTLPAVVGDLALGCYCSTSRNNNFGAKWHQSGYDAEFLKDYPLLVEGVRSAYLLDRLLEGLNLKLHLQDIISKIKFALGGDYLI